MGAPDVIEIDGLGGSRPIASKVAIVSRSQRRHADVDDTFALVDIVRGAVIYSGICGNISCGLGAGICKPGNVGDISNIHINREVAESNPLKDDTLWKSYPTGY